MRIPDEFYVGYLPFPRHLRLWIRRAVFGLVCVAVITAVLLVFGQNRFPASVFEYGRYGTYSGEIDQFPYPVLRQADGREFLLVAPGKHGADDLVRGVRGTAVRLTGSKIYRGDQQMLEVVPASVQATNEPVTVPVTKDLGRVTLTGEIVDSKCWLGVMNPGNGKVHRDCAVRCISGGVPPAFIAIDEQGRSQFMLLTGGDGRALNREVLDWLAEPVRISGELRRVNGSLLLYAEPSVFRRAGE